MLDAAATNAHAIGIQATAIVEAAAINERAASINATRSAQENSNAIVLQNAVNTGKSIDATATAQAVQDTISLADMQVAQDRVLTDTILSVTVLLLVVGISAALIIRALRPVSVGPDTDDSHDLPAYPGGLDVRLFVPSVPADVLLKVAQAYVSGTPFTHDRMTPGVISEGRFATLQHLLVRHGGARWLDAERHQVGCEMLPKGKKFFADLVAQTTSPQPTPTGFVPLPGRQDTIDRPPALSGEEV
jgi:hypothetical protein